MPQKQPSESSCGFESHLPHHRTRPREPSRSSIVSSRTHWLNLPLPPFRRFAAPLRCDLIAGLSLAAFAIPESIAYATLAGLPPVAGLYCYLVAGIGYALFGSSRHVAVGPTSALALLLATSLLPLATGDPERYAVLAAATASLVGLICVAALVVRVGVMVNFVSTVVLTGFKTGAALSIASTQLPKLFGVAGGSGNFFERIAALCADLPGTHVPSMILGLATLAALLVLAKRFPGRPTTIGVVAVVLLAMHVDPVARLGIHMAARIPDGLPGFALPIAGMRLADLTAIAPLALACFVLAYVETIATGSTLAQAHGEEIDPEKELLALGAANLFTGAFHGFPVSGGMSQSAVNDLGGARSPFALVVTSATVAIVLASLAFLFSAVPDPLLAAIVTLAALRLIRLRDLARIWNGSRHEFWVAMFAAVAVLATGLLSGVAWAVVMSLLMVVARTSRPEIAVLGNLPGSTLYVNVAYNPTAIVPDGILAIRTFGPWYYFNVAFIRRRLLELVDAATPPPHVVIVDFSASPSLDMQSCRTLETIGDDLRTRGIRLELARLYDETTNKLLRTGSLQTPLHSHETVDAIVRRFQSSLSTRP